MLDVVHHTKNYTTNPMSKDLSPSEELALTLYDVGAVQVGKFKLHSGVTSRIYLDLRVLVSFPHALRIATAAYIRVLNKLKYDLLAAPPLAGLPFGTALCLELDVPLVYPRKTSKTYGTGKEIEGHWQVGQRAVVIDDVITSGDSILQAIVALKTAGLQVKDAVVLIDRELEGIKTMKSHGYRVHAAMTISQLLAILESHDRISAKQRAKVLKSL